LKNKNTEKMMFKFLFLLSVGPSSYAFIPSTSFGRSSNAFLKLSSSTATTESNNKDEAILSAVEINSRMEKELKKMREKDIQSIEIKEEDLTILHEDDDIIVVNKPSGVLSVPGKNSNNNSMNKVVFDKLMKEGSSTEKKTSTGSTKKIDRMDRMVVHRLSMDTSGVMVFAKSERALKNMNKRFRERNVQRLYEALVCGHIVDDEGYIELPIMRDFERPPYMRISTDTLQRQLLEYDDDGGIDKKLLDLPKECITKYIVVKREELDDGSKVTRVILDSITGRTNQLNVHLAAFGHPIVGDTIYGGPSEEGALPNGGLTSEELNEIVDNPERASTTTPETSETRLYIHAQAINFDHPGTSEDVTYDCDAPF